MLYWDTLDAFLADASTIAARQQFDYLRARIEWASAPRAWAIAADAGDTMRTPLDALAPSRMTDVETFDLLANARIDVSSQWTYYAPCAELVVPFPDGADLVRELVSDVQRGPLWGHLARGASLALVRGTTDLPHSPFAFPYCGVLALRPEPRDLAAALEVQRELRALADRAVAAGARVYLASFSSEDA